MNNDRFKFRVWDKKHNCYHTSDNWFIDRDGQLWFKGSIFESGSNEDFTIEQCTGLIDKTGNLIFEGDVITTADDDEIPEEHDIYSVKWAKAYSGELFCAIDKKGKLEDFYGGIPLLEYARIIGNIHQMEVEK